MTSTYYAPRIINPGNRLSAGCYLICYTPDFPEPGVIHYDGTLRVQRVNADGEDNPTAGDFILASGDLYAHFVETPEEEPAIEDPEKIPDELPIPVFYRDEYRYYLCVKSVPYWSITTGEFNMVFESHFYDLDDGNWYPEGQFIAKMRWDLPPMGFSPKAIHATGEVFGKRGERNGALTMTWISKSFRRASVEFHNATAKELPGGKGGADAEQKWKDEFEKFNWQLKVISSPVDPKVALKAPHGVWTNGLLKEVSDEIRRKQDPDSNWRYNLLCVPKLVGEERGMTLFEPEKWSSTHARELATVASEYEFPKDDANSPNQANSPHDYNNAAGETLSSEKIERDLYYRTAMHEMGHAMGLDHNPTEYGFMMTTDALAHQNNQTGKKKFPENARFGFSDGDLQRLRHWPDVVVRPGTSADASSLPAVTVPVFPDYGQEVKLDPERERPELARDVALNVRPLLPEVPLGAPVRIEFDLLSLNDEAEKPSDPSLKSGALSVWVKGPDGSLQSVSAMSNEADAGELRKTPAPPKKPENKPGQKEVEQNNVRSAVTLFGGDNGLLFPVPGDYTVIIEVAWWKPGDKNSKRNGRSHGTELYLTDEAKVSITPTDPPDRSRSASAHVEAARLIREAPDLQEALVRHAKGFADAAVNAALDSDILAPHYAYIRFRMEADPLRASKSDLEPAFKILLDAHRKKKDAPDKKTLILSFSEAEKVQEIFNAMSNDDKKKPWGKEVEKMLTGFLQ